MIRHIRLAALWITGAIIGLIAGIVGNISSLIELMPTIIFQSFVLWIAFNFSVGSVIGFQLNFIQSLAFVFLVRVIRKLIVPNA